MGECMGTLVGGRWTKRGVAGAGESGFSGRRARLRVHHVGAEGTRETRAVCAKAGMVMPLLKSNLSVGLVLIHTTLQDEGWCTLMIWVLR